MRFSIITVTAALALSACTPDVYDINVEAPETVDTGLVDEPNPEPIIATLTVNYTNVFSGTGEFSVSRGQDQEVDFGGFQFDASESMWIEQFPVQMGVNQNPDELYSIYQDGHQGLTEASEHWENCVLREWPSLTTFAGPIDPNEDGELIFTDDFLLDGEYAPVLNLYCNHTGEWPEGQLDGFAADVSWPTEVSSVSGNEVEVEVGNRNGDYNPTTAAIVVSEPWCNLDIPVVGGSTMVHNELIMMVSNSTPSGNGFPVEFQEFARFKWVPSHSECADIYARGFNLWISASDLEETGWRDSIYVEIRNLSVGTTLWSGTVPAHEPVPVQFADAIPAGSMHTIGVFLDPTDASAAEDDTVQVIVMENSIDWSDWTVNVEDKLNPNLMAGIIQF